MAPDGGDEAIGFEVPNADEVGICVDRLGGLGQVGVGMGTEAQRLLEGEPVGRTPVVGASRGDPHVGEVEHRAAKADGRALVAERVDGGHG